MCERVAPIFRIIQKVAQFWLANGGSPSNSSKSDWLAIFSHTQGQLAVPLAVLRILLLFAYNCEWLCQEYSCICIYLWSGCLCDWIYDWWQGNKRNGSDDGKNDSKLGRCQCHVVIVMRWQHCASSTISHPLYSILSIFGAPFLFHTRLPNLTISLPFLAVSSATITNKSDQ